MQYSSFPLGGEKIFQLKKKLDVSKFGSCFVAPRSNLSVKIKNGEEAHFRQVNLT